MGSASAALGLKHSNSHSSNKSSSTLFGGQDEALKDIFSRIKDVIDQNQYQNDIYGAGQQSNRMRDQLFSQMMTNNSIANSKQVAPYDNDFAAQLKQRMLQPTGRSNVGTMYENIVGGPGNTYIDPMVDAMRQDAAENYRAFQGDNSFDAMMHGASGGSRQAMTDAIAQRQMNRDLTAAETNLRGNNYDRDMAMKMGIARQADTNTQADRDRYADTLNNMGQYGLASNNQMQQGYQNFMPLINSYQNPYMQAQQALWNPYNNMRNIIGPAIMNKQASGNASGHMFDFNTSASGSFDPSKMMGGMG